MQELGEVQQVVWRVPGVRELDIEEVAPGNPEALSFFLTKNLRMDGREPLVASRALRPVWLTFGLILCFVIVYSLAMDRLTSTFAAFLFPQPDTLGTFAGTITDTRCGAHHSMLEAAPGGACVRSCVRFGSKCALLAGKDLYVLSDQQASERFAGQSVRVAGTLDVAKKSLQVESITPAS